MSRIKGLNDTVTLKKRAIKPAITVWKGAKKTDKGAGRSLNEYFRIEAPNYLRSVIKSELNAQEKDGSLLVKQINLVPAYEDPYKTFDSKMAAYSASRPLLFCDREIIHTEFIENKDSLGNIYFQPIHGNKPCPVAGTNYDCVNRCSRTGDFYFYIWELLLAGYGEFARLQVHGVEDNQTIADVLDNIHLELGTIKNSPFVSEETRSYLVYQLTRRKVKSKFPVKENGIRTAKRGTKDDWICNLQLSPLWLNRYQYFKQSQQLQALNYQPSIKLIHQVYGENMIAPTANPQLLIPPKDNLKEYKKDLAIAFKNNGWSKQGWLEMMDENFSTTVVSEELDLELLLAIANSGEERDKFCEF